MAEIIDPDTNPRTVTKSNAAMVLAVIGILLGLAGLFYGMQANNTANQAKRDHAELQETVDKVMTTLDQAAPGGTADDNNNPDVDTPRNGNTTPNGGGQ